MSLSKSGSIVQAKEIIFNKEVAGGHGGGDELLVKELDKAMIYGTSPPTSMNDAIKSVITCLGIDYAMNKGEVVDLSSLWKEFSF